MTGLHSIVAFVRVRPHFSNNYISGIDDDVVRLLVIAALSAAPTDAIFNLLMKDDRLAPWSVFVGAVGMLVQGLRSGATSAALASTCFSMWRMHRARRPPFTLFGDHKAEESELFSTAARPHDVVAQRIFDLLELGFPAEPVIAGLQLPEQVSWSSLRDEQWLLYAAFPQSPAVLSQYDAMP